MRTKHFLSTAFLFIVVIFNSKAQELILDDYAPHRMSIPPYEAVYATSEIKATPLTLKQLRVNQNDIIDQLEWFQDNELSIPRVKIPNDPSFLDKVTPYELAPEIPLQSGAVKLIAGIVSPQANFYFYGVNFLNVRYLLITGPDNAGIKHFLDFGTYLGDSYSNNRWSMKLLWAAIDDNVLYVSNAHSTYASETGGINAFITAIDLETLKVIWRSEPLVSNAKNFEIIGDVIVCGYGFTKEPDYLAMLDKYSGRNIGTRKLASAPEYIIRKDDKLHVRTYDRDYLFGIE